MDNDKSKLLWIQLIVAIWCLLIFTGLIVVTLLFNDHQSFTLLCGAAISMATGAVGFYFGSTSSEAQKTALLAASTPSTPQQPNQN